LSNRVAHFEINVKNAEKAIKFYKNIFGWKIEQWEGPMEYWLITTGDERKPGINSGVGKVE
jgi:predicted enzyme related to lactoylglutathione lyase